MGIIGQIRDGAQRGMRLIGRTRTSNDPRMARSSYRAARRAGAPSAGSGGGVVGRVTSALRSRKRT